jgi:hypothetical protein
VSSGLDLRLASRPRSDDDQTFSASRLQQSAIERHERNGLSELTLQEQAARKLYRVTSAQNMAREQRARVGGYLRGHFHHRESGHVILEGSQDPITSPIRQRSLSRTTDDTRCHLDL